VLAVGEGPSSFTDFFAQQYRWSRGTFEALRGHLWRCLPGLSPGSKLHYLLISSYYPSAAIAWILGALNCLLYLVLGTTGVRVQPQAWLAIYLDLALVQFSFYASNRKHNVSPHEAKGSSGVAGMFISALAAPVYVAALLGTVTSRKASFVVTPKGDSQSPDGLLTFGRHLRWAGLFAAGLAASLWIDHPQSTAPVVDHAHPALPHPSLDLVGPELRTSPPDPRRAAGPGAAGRRRAGCRGEGPMRTRRGVPVRRLQILAGILALAAAVAINGPLLLGLARHVQHERLINSTSYKRHNGHWSILSVPASMRVNAIHAALLYTGKVLIIAGSGNDVAHFEAGKFESILWDPKTDKFKKIDTPTDMFCGGHAFLPDGKLLIAGGTSRYEALPGQVHYAAGIMSVTNTSADHGTFLRKGTTFAAADGRLYRSTAATLIPRARERLVSVGGLLERRVVPSVTRIWVSSVTRGAAGVTRRSGRYLIAGLPGPQARAITARAANLTLGQQDFGGTRASYIFDPATERYSKVPSMTMARWYPTLVGLADGKVLSVSGLDRFGQIVPGNNEVFDPRTRR
jgi:GlxA beta barrel domain